MFNLFLGGENKIKLGIFAKQPITYSNISEIYSKIFSLVSMTNFYLVSSRGIRIGISSHNFMFRSMHSQDRHMKSMQIFALAFLFAVAFSYKCKANVYDDSYGSFANTCINTKHEYNDMCIVGCHSIMRSHAFYDKMKLIVDRKLTHVQIFWWQF